MCKKERNPLYFQGIPLFFLYRNDVIRTRDLFVPNEALYQAEPHSDIFGCTSKTVLRYISIIKCNCLEKNECFCG